MLLGVQTRCICAYRIISKQNIPSLTCRASESQLFSSFEFLVQKLTPTFTFTYNITPISCVSILYISVLESHTASVLPQHTVIDEQIPCLAADETITEGKRLSDRSLSDSQSRLQQPTKTPHEAPERQNGRCFCRVKHFPRYKTTERGLSGRGNPYADDALISFHVTIVSEVKAHHPRNDEHYFCNVAYLKKHDPTTAA